MFVAWTLVFGEVFVRIFVPQPLVPRYVTGAPYGIRMNVPGATYWQTTADARVQIRINEQGIRADRMIPLAKPPGICRILMLGDSFFLGFEAALEDSLQGQIEKMLTDEGHTCEVINLAVSGFGTAENLVTLREKGMAFQPDIVLLEMNETDLEDNERSNLFVVRGGRLVQVSTEYLPGVAIADRLRSFLAYRWTDENSQLYSIVRERLGTFLKGAVAKLRGGRNGEDSGAGRPVDQSRRHLNSALVEEIRQVVRGKADLVLVDIPKIIDRGHLVHVPLLVEEEALEASPAYVEVSEVLRAAATRRPVHYQRGHGHLTPFGNMVVARRVVDVIEATLAGTATQGPALSASH